MASGNEKSVSGKSKSNIYETITAKIIAAIESCPGEPVMPWQRGGFRPTLPVNATTHQPYRGINILSLWVSALERGYEAGEWATLRQWNTIGAQVRKGERASPIVFYREIETHPGTRSAAQNGAGDSAGSEGDTEVRRMARGYWVFAAEQVDGYTPTSALPQNPVERIAAAEAYFAATGARVIVGGSRACYRPSTDTIHMPDEARFTGHDARMRTDAWYRVLSHETAHWTSPPHRLDRQLGKRFGDDQYAMEECIADTAACFVCARLGIAGEPHPDHARYIHHWLSVMTADAKAIFTAAAKAQEIVGYLDGLQAKAAQQRAA
jgi:antirestriction protein ArdC